MRSIQSALERSRSREQFELISRGAVRIDDLRRALLDNEPQVVHFSGHGAGIDGIALENISGDAQLVSTESLSNLFELFKDKVECVLLNACYSEIQAETIYHHIDCVIGMEHAVTDIAAINFSTAFYDALGAGRSYAESFQEAEKRHPSQKISHGPKTQDGKPTYLDYNIKLPQRSLNEFSRWVYRFMGSAQFLTPVELAEKHKTWCAGIASSLFVKELLS